MITIIIGYLFGWQMMQVEIKHLKLLQTIAETENLTRAARRLHVSQPALSRQLLDIEARLGTRLFYRSKKRMVLTPEGLRLLQTADVILDELRTAELDISKIVNGETGTLHIGVSCLFCFQWLPAVVAEFQRHYPKVDLAISTCRDLHGDLDANIFDMVVTAQPLAAGKVAAVELFRDEMVAVMAPDHPLSTRHYLTAADIAESKLIVSSHKPVDSDATHLRRCRNAPGRAGGLPHRGPIGSGGPPGSPRRADPAIF